MFFRIAKATLCIILIAVIQIGTLAHWQSTPASAVPTGTMGAQTNEDIEIGSRFAELIFGKRKNEKSARDVKEIYLCPGGDAFGVKILAESVSVSRIVTPLEEGELEIDDIILSINGKEVHSIADVKNALTQGDGGTLDFSIIRNGKRITEHIRPLCCGSEHHLGVILTDLTSGIGTITYYNPVTLEFGGLGHGIVEKSGKSTLKLTRGTATGVILGGIKKGKDGVPGELRGVLTDKSLGTVLANTDCGVFGTLTTYVADSEPIRCAERSEVKCGEATIISTVKSGNKSEYSIRISDIDLSSSGSKSFRITVTDEALIALTGGIVRGMSGSPIIQDGKLIGAVTHVMVADPTEGYGIFIENMLNASQTNAQKAA